MVEDTTGKMEATSHPRVEGWKWRSALTEWNNLEWIRKSACLIWRKKQLELQSKATELEGFMQRNIRIYCIKEEARGGRLFHIEDYLLRKELAESIDLTELGIERVYRALDSKPVENAAACSLGFNILKLGRKTIMVRRKKSVLWSWLHDLFWALKSAYLKFVFFYLCKANNANKWKQAAIKVKNE